MCKNYIPISILLKYSYSLEESPARREGVFKCQSARSKRNSQRIGPGGDANQRFKSPASDLRLHSKLAIGV